MTTKTDVESSSSAAADASYQRVSGNEDTNLVPPPRDLGAARITFYNFVAMSVLFSANHGCTVACLALATARLGHVGAFQSGTLYLTYTASAVMGATYVVKLLGARNSIIAGMTLYCVYVGCFFVATYMPVLEIPAALLGAAVGGVGGGFLWTAQGAYFSKAAQVHSQQLGQESAASSTSLFAGVFAFVYLAEEVLLRALSTALVSVGIQWGTVFGVYTMVAIVSTFGMVWIHNFPPSSSEETAQEESVLYKITAAWQLLRSDPKMKYMIGLNAVFGFAGAFLNSYVNGEVVKVALHDEESKYVGILSAMVAAVAAVCSLVFARVTQVVGKGPVLILGAVAFFFVAFPFVVFPDVSTWGWGLLICIYALHGVGRATFEGTLKATFADYFPQEREGAFANIILQNGLASAIGFFLSFRLTCSEPSPYCVEYRDGTMHDVLSFELLVVVTAVLAIVGYLRASILFKREQAPHHAEGETELLENEAAVSS